ncbi:glycosyltransferase family 2 protein [Polaromonas sp. YR568]|uniref:glycosyltransferase family 2 protein n=1 Tax=Polaromonas sp. YR568 TaxID=1855301 RepID=UPI00398BF1F1
MASEKKGSSLEVDIPICSICIANYNGMEVIDDCLRSVVEQHGHLSLEILVHDDASNDGSADHIRRHYPQVKLIVSDSNVGFCIANNRMAAAAKGEYLLLLNNDAVLYADALISLTAEAKRLGQAAVLSLPQHDAKSLNLVDRGCLLDPFFNPVPNLDPMRTDVAMVIGACLWIPKGLWNELGGFPEWFGSVAEDMHLCCQARLAGYPVRVLASSGYRHHQGKSFGGNRLQEGQMLTTYRRRAFSERNKTYALVMVSPPLQLALVLPIHLLLISLEGAVVALLKTDMNIWRLIYGPIFPSLWRERRKIIGCRAEIQRRRVITLRDWCRGFVAFPRKLTMLVKYGIPQIR